MTIEFSCSHCHRMLTTPDEKAGLKAKCPGCSQYCPIPDPGREWEADAMEADEPFFEEDEFLLGEMVTCPVCGHLMDSYHGTCQACENKEAIREFENDSSDEIPSFVWKSGKIRLTAVLSRSCRLYKQNFFSCNFASVVSGLLAYASTQAVLYLFAILFAGGFLGAVATESMALMFVTVLLIPGGFLLMFFISSMMFCYFLLGFQAFFLRVVQEQRAGIREMFNIRPYFWRMYLSTLVLAFFVLPGLVFLIIPSLLFLFFFWPYAFFLVDQNLPGISSLSESPKLMKGNRLRLAIIFLSLWGLGYAGMQGQSLADQYCRQVLTLTADQSEYLSLGVTGIVSVFVISVATLVLAVTYAEMTGQ